MRVRRPDLLDHLIGGRKQLVGDRKAERLGRLAVDHQLESGRLLDGKLAGLGAAQDFVDIGSRLPRDRIDVGRVAEKSAFPSPTARSRSPTGADVALQTAKCADDW